MFSIEPFAPQYQEGVVDVILPIQQAEFQIPITLADQPDLLDIPGFYQRGNGNFWIARSEGAVVGTIALLDIGNAQGALRKMFVKASHRGRELGVARLLLASLLQWAFSSGLRTIYLGTTARFLAAHRFYEKHGFLEVEKSELPPAFPVMSVDTKFYRLELNNLSVPR
jgi:N-acetylglutamate synthase-like GNAT family acetyltransferase